MKNKRMCIFISCVFVFFSLTSVINVNAMNTGFQTLQLPAEKKDLFISNIDLSRTDDEPTKKPILCFDVNESGLIAIGQNTTDKKTVCVYSTDGVFQYGFTFNCSGSFGLEWDEANLNIYFVRSSVIVSVSHEGEIIDAFKVQDTIENNSYVNHFINSTEKSTDNAEFVIRNDLGILNIFAPSYSQIIMKDHTGAETVIYDVSALQLSRITGVICVACLSVLIAIAEIIRQFVMLRHRRTQEQRGRLA